MCGGAGRHRRLAAFAISVLAAAPIGCSIDRAVAPSEAPPRIVASTRLSSLDCIVRPPDLGLYEYKQYLLPATFTVSDCLVRVTVTDSLADVTAYDPNNPNTWRIAAWGDGSPHAFRTEWYPGNGGARVPNRVAFTIPVAHALVTTYWSMVAGNTIAAYDASGQSIELWSVPYVPCSDSATWASNPPVYSHTFEAANIGTIVITPGVRFALCGNRVIDIGVEVHFQLPPCPPSGDSILDDPTVRDSLRAGLAASNPDSTPGSGWRHEVGGVVWRHIDGTFLLQRIQDPQATECVYHSQAAPPPNPGDIAVAIWHTHPSLTGEQVYGCPGRSQAPGDGRPTARAAPTSNGGGSDADWNATNDGFPDYVYAKERLLFRLDPGTPAAERSSNPHRWLLSTQPPGCASRIL